MFRLIARVDAEALDVVEQSGLLELVAVWQALSFETHELAAVLLDLPGKVRRALPVADWGFRDSLIDLPVQRTSWGDAWGVVGVGGHGAAVVADLAGAYALGDGDVAFDRG